MRVLVKIIKYLFFVVVGLYAVVLMGGPALFFQQMLSCWPAMASCFASSVVSSLLLVDSGAAGGLLASGKWCRLQHSNIDKNRRF